ncbi:casein kinase II, regulatory subunit, partial [Neoconidiobolus thromboides FSU 785]
VSWVHWYCSMSGNEFYCEVPEEYIEDDFNLTGLPSLVKDYDRCIDTILDIEQEEMESDTDEALLEENAEKLYGLIHARYIITKHGLYTMHNKYANGAFGVCPRDLCYGAHVLPVGISDVMNVSTVKLFCPSCLDLYNPPSSRYSSVDGAFFGTTFPHLFMLTYPDVIHCREPEDGIQFIYQERIFGFKVNENAASGGKMKWLRRY